MPEPTPEEESRAEELVYGYLDPDYDRDNFEIDREQNRYERHIWGD